MLTTMAHTITTIATITTTFATIIAALLLLLLLYLLLSLFLTQPSSCARARTEACRKDKSAGELFGQASIRTRTQDGNCYLLYTSTFTTIMMVLRVLPLLL